MSPSYSLPTCLFVGPQKAGTSWIYTYLLARRDFCLPHGVKETFFFDQRFERKDLTWYRSHFCFDSARHAHVTEVAPTYFQSPQACQRIRDVCGEIPIVVTLRQPARRSESLYLHLVRYGYTKAPLRQAIEQFPEIIDSSRYAKHLENWIVGFGAGRVSVLTQEELGRSPFDYVAKLCKALDVPEIGVDFDFHQRVNEASDSRSSTMAFLSRTAGDFLRDRRLYWPINFAKKLGLKSLVFGHRSNSPRPSLSNSDRQWVEGQLTGEIEKLERILGISLSDWRKS